MTESTAVGTRGFNVAGKTYKYTSVGLLAPNMEAKVVNCSTGSCMKPGKAGELLLRGPGVMKGETPIIINLLFRIFRTISINYELLIQH